MCFSVKLRVYAAENDTRMISEPTLATCWQIALDCKMRSDEAKLPTIINAWFSAGDSPVATTMVASSGSNETQCSKTGTTHNFQIVAPTPDDPALAVLDAVSTKRREIAYNFIEAVQPQASVGRGSHGRRSNSRQRRSTAAPRTSAPGTTTADIDVLSRSQFEDRLLA
eukprot:gene27644-7901_t